MMIAMPVLSLEQMHQREPFYVAAGILPERNSRLGMAYAVHETLGVKSEAQADRAEPEKRSGTEIQSTEIRKRENRGLEPSPRSIRKPAQVGAITIDRRLTR